MPDPSRVCGPLYHGGNLKRSERALVWVPTPLLELTTVALSLELGHNLSITSGLFLKKPYF